MQGYTIAVVGATGAVGTQMIKMLEESSLPISKMRLLASVRSAGKPFLLEMKKLSLKRPRKKPLMGLTLHYFQQEAQYQQGLRHMLLKLELLLLIIPRFLGRTQMFP